jgi:hypothetical protein
MSNVTGWRKGEPQQHGSQGAQPADLSQWVLQKLERPL